MPPIADPTPRQAWIALLATAPGPELARLAQALPPPARLPPHHRLRGPELGLVMLQGRAGGTGAPFNLGEATVARCTVQLGDGQVGHAYRLGTDLEAAELAATLDAALQDPARHGTLDHHVLTPLQQAAERAQAETARQAAATQVEFFTLATMRSSP